MIIKINNRIKHKLLRYINKTTPGVGQYLRQCQFQIKCLLYKSRIKKYVLDKMKEKTFPLFNMIEIETINKCNGTCKFCPVNRNNDSRPRSVMSEKLYCSIIRQLHDLNYADQINIFSNNEPLLDKRTVKFCSHAREKVPKAFLVLYTNGTLLTPEIFAGLMKSLDSLVIDNYIEDLDNYKLIKPVQELYDRFKDDDRYNNVEIHIRDVNEVLYTRGGNSPNRTKVSLTTNCPCTLPYRQMVIRPDGKISLCCADTLGEMTLGDAEKMSLVEIWNNDIYKRIRAELLESRAHIKLCSGCDAI